MASNILDCAANISDETLSAWRDYPPATEEMARFQSHLATCPACQRRLADFEHVAAALLRQREIEPGDRILVGVRQRANERRIRPYHGSSRRLWHGLGALATVAAVVGLFVYVFGGVGGHPIGSPPASQSVAPTHSATPAATLTPAPAIDSGAIWGNHAATVLSTMIDAHHFVSVTNITPDGKYLLGYELTLTSDGTVDQNLPAQAGYMDVATKQFTAIGVTDVPPFAHGCCQSDGRFLLATQDTAPGATCGLCHLDYWAYDMTTGQKYRVAHGTDYQEIQRVYLSHGLLALWTGEGIKVADLAAHTVSALANISPSAQPEAFSWPYLLYSTPITSGASSQTRVRDLSTSRDIALPQVDAVFSSPSEYSTGFAFAGDTLFTVGEDFGTSGSASAGESAVYELDSVMRAGSQLRAVALFNSSMSSALAPLGANSRLVVFNGWVFDRAQRYFVAFYAMNRYITPTLSGNYLLTYLQSDSPSRAVHPTVSIYNTATLPTRSGA